MFRMAKAGDFKFCTLYNQCAQVDGTLAQLSDLAHMLQEIGV